MATTKNTQINLKRSSVSGKVPTTTQLELGELAVNTYDGKLYLKKNDGSGDVIVDVTAAGSVDHNSLAGLQGGAADEFYHLTAAQVASIGSGGATNLDGLSDVAIATPLDNQVLTYDSALGIWKNEAPTGGGTFDGSNVAITGGSISGVSLSTTTSISVQNIPFGTGGGNNSDNVAIGNGALANFDPPTDGSDLSKSFNVGIGFGALGSSHGSNASMAIGASALMNNTAGNSNLAIGALAFRDLTSGNNNIGIGTTAGGASWNANWLQEGDGNIFIGGEIRPNANICYNSIQIGAPLGKGSNTVVIGSSAHTATYLYGTLFVNDTEFTGGGAGPTPGPGTQGVSFDFGSFTTPALSMDFGSLV